MIEDYGTERHFWKEEREDHRRDDWQDNRGIYLFQLISPSIFLRMSLFDSIGINVPPVSETNVPLVSD